ncbi:MAG: hypothetical protein KDK27_03645 [Leptospiraceae bacterium]|nr:hypothetical protein [Leptospiraceae bacterium]
MSKSRENIIALIDRALERNQSITLITHYLSDYGEMILDAIVRRITETYGRPDLADIVYTSIKELVMNAAKANLKRVLLLKYNLNPEDPEHYEECMRLFKQNLPENRIRTFRRDFKTHNLPIKITFMYRPHKVLKVAIKNNFTLLPQEEERIREKFKTSAQYTDLMQFYLEHGDDTEGAGMGITLVGILLTQSGINKRNFAVYSSHADHETVARLEIPLARDYETSRDRFAREVEERGISPDEYRQSLQTDA